MKKLMFIGVLGLLLVACGGGNSHSESAASSESEAKETLENGNPTYDPKRGEGKFKEVSVGKTLDAALAEKGNKVSGVKCSSCHKTTEEKLVGPGWKGVTSRHSPEWIMNFITNTDEMLNKDPKAQAQLEICLVRMPNQNLSDDDARSLFEFMRKVDGIK
jgi:cytochrome c551/c552